MTSYDAHLRKQRRLAAESRKAERRCQAVYRLGERVLASKVVGATFFDPVLAAMRESVIVEFGPQNKEKTK